MAQANIYATKNWLLQITATVGSGYRGDIAIDDLLFTGGSCPPMGSCNFESSTCLWKNTDKYDQFDWERTHGSTHSPGTGPDFDVTLRSAQGSYMYIEASAPRKIGDEAWLVSPQLHIYNHTQAAFLTEVFVIVHNNLFNINSSSMHTHHTYIVIQLLQQCI